MAKKKTSHALKNVPKRKQGEKTILVMDPIHNFIDISEYPVIKEIIDTPHFQRLRRLHQLGMTSSVYPNATHSRFAHSIGVMHVFSIMFDSIMQKSEIKKSRIEQLRPIGAVAALLHDVGHGPFSHASEHILENGKFDHEVMTREIIKKTEIGKVLKKHKIDSQLICDVLNHEVSGDLLILSQLISSQLDADRLDYLIRDSFFTGVQYGKIDVHRIANTLEIWTKNKPKSYRGTIIVSRKGIEAIEDYILGRYLMYRGVYFHKVTRCMERILVNIFKRVTKSKEALKDLKKIVDINKKVTPEILLSLDDYVCYSLFRKWTKSKDPILKDLCRRIIDRDILKSYETTPDEIISIGIDELPKLKQIFKKKKINFDFYFIQDNQKKSAYDPYQAEQIDDTYTTISHIMIPTEKGDDLREISTESTVVQALSQDKKIKLVRIFYPKQLTQQVSKILHH